LTWFWETTAQKAFSSCFPQLLPETPAVDMRRSFRSSYDSDTCHSVGPITGHSLFATSDISASRVVCVWVSVAVTRHRQSWDLSFEIDIAEHVVSRLGQGDKANISWIRESIGLLTETATKISPLLHEPCRCSNQTLRVFPSSRTLSLS
jgi:hypothetical protein